MYHGRDKLQPVNVTLVDRFRVVQVCEHVAEQFFLVQPGVLLIVLDYLPTPVVRFGCVLQEYADRDAVAD